MKRLFFFFLILLFLVSCTTTRVEYVAVSPDYSSVFEPLFSARPHEPEIIEDVKSLGDALSNSVAFQQAYYDYVDYSKALEDAIKTVLTPLN